MLDAFARQLRDTLVQRLPYNVDHPKMNIREWTYAAFTRFLELSLQERNAYVALLDECIAHVQGGFPFNVDIDSEKGATLKWVLRCGGLDEARIVRQKMLFEFMRVDLMFPQESGEILFGDLEPFRIMKQIIDEFDDFIEGGLKRTFSRLELRPHEHNDGYDLMEILPTEEIRVMQLYTGKLTTRLMKILFEHDGKEMLFAEIYRLIQATEKADHRIPQLIRGLKIDEGVRKGRYITLKGDSLIFRSSFLEPRKG